MKQDDSTLTDFAAMLKRAWWHRPGYEVIGQVLDVFDALNFETKAGMKPVLAHKHRIAGGWHLVFHLPPGIKSADVEAEREHFQEQTGARVEFKPMDAKLHMDIRTMDMPKIVDYLWAPNPKMLVPFPIGFNGTEMLVVDLAGIPHLIVGGDTGQGKTTFLLIAAMVLLEQDILLGIIDLKGTDFVDLQEHAALADSPETAGQLLEALNREMDRRKKVFQTLRIKNITQYRGGDMKRIAVIIDELAELQDKESQQMLLRLARLSRAFGYHLIPATQRPSHSVYDKFTDLRMLFAGRMCFWMPDDTDSRLILANDAAAKLDPEKKGRAIWQWGKQTEVQCMYLGDDDYRKRLASLPLPGRVIPVERRATRLLPR